MKSLLMPRFQNNQNLAVSLEENDLEFSVVSRLSITRGNEY